MGNFQLINKTRSFSFNLTTKFFTMLFVLITVMFFYLNSFAQRGIWRYIATLSDGTKIYLSDDERISKEKNKNRWEKIIKSDGSSAIALVEWNCIDKFRLVRQITFYNSDQSVISTKKIGFDWAPIIPGSAADFLYYPVCLPPTNTIKAEILADNTKLRAFPNISAQVLRTANRGEKFQVVPDTGQNNWYNLVDETTQEDFWLAGDLFKIILITPRTQSSKNKTAKLPKPKNRAAKRRKQ